MAAEFKRNIQNRLWKASKFWKYFCLKLEKKKEKIFLLPQKKGCWGGGVNLKSLFWCLKCCGWRFSASADKAFSKPFLLFPLETGFCSNLAWIYKILNYISFPWISISSRNSFKSHNPTLLLYLPSCFQHLTLWDHSLHIHLWKKPLRKVSFNLY